MAEAAARRRTIGIVVVGNEVLSGKVQELNAAFLIKRFRELGARVREVAIVEDEVPAIVRAVQRLSGECDEVLTTGGVGPTHDDVTVEAVARAFGVEVIESPEILERLAGFVKGPLTAGQRRLCRVPAGSAQVWGKRFPWPIAHLGNVWLFPGVPPLLQSLFEDAREHFEGSPPWHQAALELVTDESSIVEALDGLVVRHTLVAIGSYPRREDGTWKLRLTFEGDSEAAVAAALGEAALLFAAWSPPSP